MKDVLFIMTDLEGGGAEKALVSLLKEFDYSRYRVTLCLMFHRGVYLNDIPTQVRLVYLFEKEDSYWNRKAVRRYFKHHSPIIYSLLFHLKLKRKYDAIISFMEGRPAMLHSHIMKRGKKNISWVHCDLLNYHFSHTCYDDQEKERHCYESMDELVFVSHMAMSAFNTLYNIQTSQRYLYNIVDKNGIAELSNSFIVEKERFTITLIGNLYRVKGFDRLVHVAKLLKTNGYILSFQIIGEGDERQSLEKLIAENDLSEDVKLLGFQPNPYPYLKRSDILLSTSRSEGLSYAICEALVLGIPVVATRTAGATELLDDGKYGVLVEQNIESIFEGVKKLIDDLDCYEDCKRRSVLRSRIFDNKQIMAKVYELIG